MKLVPSTSTISDFNEVFGNPLVVSGLLLARVAARRDRIGAQLEEGDDVQPRDRGDRFKRIERKFSTRTVMEVDLGVPGSKSRLKS